MGEKKSVKKELGGHKNQNVWKSNWQKFNIIKTKLLSVAFFDTYIFVVSLHLDRLLSRPERYKCKYGRISREFQWSTSRLDHRGPTERRPRSEPGEPNSRF